MSVWSRSSFASIADSIRYHFGEHGAEVGATDVWQYLRKAYGFKLNLRGVSRRQLAAGKVRHIKKGHFLILDAQGKIVSFGAAS